MPTIIATTWPNQAIKDEFAAGVVNRKSWLDIYDADGTTLLWGDVKMTEGVVSIDSSRTERRNFEVNIIDKDRLIGYGPTKFWYDKVLKPYTGIVLANGDTWAMQMGEYLPDTITRPHFPEIMSVSCRDFTKKLINSKFDVTTTFTSGTNVGSVMSAIATNGGITKIGINTVVYELALDITFERGTERMAAITELATSIGYDVFFRADGFLEWSPFKDPSSPTGEDPWVFTTVPVTSAYGTTHESNLVSFSLSTNDTYLKNKVVVYGEGTENAEVYAVASNTTASSPTRIAAIGERVELIPSQFVATNAAAQDLADKILSVSALEQYDMQTEGVVIPWLLPGQVVEFHNPDGEVGDPIQYLVSSVSIPLDLGSMSGTVKRVTIVG